MIPICRELSTKSGFIDLLYINEFGFITIGECKLWRNPEARRKVIGQILDYAKDLAKWDYEKFEKECIKSRKGKEKDLFTVIQNEYPDVEESDFIDSVQSNLKKGRFLLTIIGDGIRENMEELANYIHRNANLNFTLALIELPIYQNPETNELILTPRILAKTKEIERIIYRLSDSETELEDTSKVDEENNTSQTISEKVFYERLTNSIGKESSKEFQKFVATLSTELNIVPNLGRGKRLSLNLKSSNLLYNFASIQETGEVWYYGIINRTKHIGDEQIGIDYLEQVASKIKGELYTKNIKYWSWGVRRNGNYINITEYLSIKNKWKDIISETLEKINKLEEENENGT